MYSITFLYKASILLTCTLLLGACEGTTQDHVAGEHKFSTYCNPIDIDYSYMSHYAHRGVSYRSGADPAAINFKGKYFLFVTRSHGYWMSDDMSTWTFIRPQSWYFNGSNAPAAAVLGDEVIVLGDPSGRGAVIKTDNPELGDWKTTYSVIPIGIQDPCLFVDDDMRVFLYEGSSNKWPIYGVELDANNHFIPLGEQQELFNLEPEKHGWERFGQDHQSDLKPFIEGPWMVRHGDTYYLEYSAPGTQWNVYADGVYTADEPLGPFTYAPYNPVSYKPGGFITGAGHGSTVGDNHGQYWHFASMPISVNFKFERRIGMFPAGFEPDGQMYVNTAYGDYPHFLPDVEVADHKNRFAGWMLLSYRKNVRSNSELTGVPPNIVDESDEGYMLEQEDLDYGAHQLTDENIRTYWVAESNSDSVFVEIDLGETMQVHAVQINFQDFRSEIVGRPSLTIRFVIEYSVNGRDWNVMADYSNSRRDQPHAYIELPSAVEAQFVRYRHVHSPHEYLAMSELRVFGKGNGDMPQAPSAFQVVRQDDRRNADLAWDPVDGAQGYVVYWGIREGRLNNSVMVYGRNQYTLRALSTDQRYYYQVEAFSENGISERSPAVETE